MSDDAHVHVTDFLYEIGTMRKLMRMHSQALLTNDQSDNIASHSFRVALIGWMLAKEEGADPYKVVMMCLLHDVGETRSNDHNWVHKRYIKVYEEEILEEQFAHMPYPELKEFATEFKKRKSKEAQLAKDADLLDQVLLLKEYEQQGNKEASVWLRGKRGDTNEQLKNLQFASSKKIGKAVYEQGPSEWWKNLWTSNNR